MVVRSLDVDRAAELFRDRAVDAGASTEDLSTTSVEDVCRRLDGIPLSIELAAARARSLGVDAVVAGLEDRFALLTGGRRRRSERHQTMRTTIDWSYRLLTPDEQRLFRWLAVHLGFELDTATVVGTRMGASGAALAPLLASLVDKNMVDVDHGAAPPRYRLLETLRAYGLEQLGDEGETIAAGEAHAVAMTAYAGVNIDDDDPDGTRLLRLEREAEGWRAAVEWAINHRRSDLIGPLAGDAAAFLVMGRPAIADGIERALDIGLADREQVLIAGLCVRRAVASLDVADLQRWIDIALAPRFDDPYLRYVQARTSISLLWLDDVAGALERLLALRADPQCSPRLRDWASAWAAIIAFSRHVAVDGELLADVTRIAATGHSPCVRASAAQGASWGYLDVDPRTALEHVDISLKLLPRLPYFVRRVTIIGSASRVVAAMAPAIGASRLLHVIDERSPLDALDWTPLVYGALLLDQIHHPVAGPALATLLHSPAAVYFSTLGEPRAGRRVGHRLHPAPGWLGAGLDPDGARRSGRGFRPRITTDTGAARASRSVPERAGISTWGVAPKCRSGALAIASETRSRRLVRGADRRLAVSSNGGRRSNPRPTRRALRIPLGAPNARTVSSNTGITTVRRVLCRRLSAFVSVGHRWLRAWSGTTRHRPGSAPRISAEHDGRPVCALLVQRRIEQAARGLSGGNRAAAEVADVAGRRRRARVSDVPGDVREVEAFLGVQRGDRRRTTGVGP